MQVREEIGACLGKLLKTSKFRVFLAGGGDSSGEVFSGGLFGHLQLHGALLRTLLNFLEFDIEVFDRSLTRVLENVDIRIIEQHDHAAEFRIGAKKIQRKRRRRHKLGIADRARIVK